MNDVTFQNLVDEQRNIVTEINGLKYLISNLIVHLQNVVNSLDAVSAKSANWAESVEINSTPKPGSLGSITKSIG